MKKSCNIGSPDFISQVETIEASDCGPCANHRKNRPCRLILKDGRVVPRAICVEEHRGFEGKWWIHPNAVERIEPSKERLPAPLATKLYAAGESGMGYMVFKIRFKDGTTCVFLTGGNVDFPDLPEGYSADDVDDVFPHEGRCERMRRGRSFELCFYVKG